MKTSNFYNEERATVIENLTAIVDSAKAEGRELTEGESTEFDSLNDKATALDAQAKRAASFEAMNAAKAEKAEKIEEVELPKELRDYSFQEAMKQAYSGRLSGLTAEMDQEARRAHPNQMFRGVAVPSAVLEARAVGNAATNSTEVMSFTDQLQANLVLASAGANFYSSIADQKFPVMSGISSSFVAETGGNVAAAGTATSSTLSPKKMISIVEISAEAMAQNAGVEAAVRKNLAMSIASTLEKALLADANITNAPASIFAGAAAQTVAGAAPTIAELLAMESELISNGVNLEGARMAWLLDGGALSEARQLAQVANVSPAYDNVAKELLGYFAFASSNVGNEAGTGTNYLLGDMSKIHIGFFQGLDLLFDPYTNASAGTGRLIATSLCDGLATQNNTAFIRVDNA